MQLNYEQPMNNYLEENKNIALIRCLTAYNKRRIVSAILAVIQYVLYYEYNKSYLN